MIFVTGDCHGNFERFKPEYFPEQAQMTKVYPALLFSFKMGASA